MPVNATTRQSAATPVKIYIACPSHRIVSLSDVGSVLHRTKADIIKMADQASIERDSEINVNPTVTKQITLSAAETMTLMMMAVKTLSKLFKLAFLGNNSTLTIKPGTKKNKPMPITSRNAVRMMVSI